MSTIPLGRLTILTGVSGSGKSSLMHGALSPAVREALSKGRRAKSKEDKAWNSLAGFENLEYVHEVDQSPIGKTSRSCPATRMSVSGMTFGSYSRRCRWPVARGYTACPFFLQHRRRTLRGLPGQWRGEGGDEFPANHSGALRRCAKACASMPRRWRSNTAASTSAMSLRMSIDDAAKFFAPVADRTTAETVRRHRAWAICNWASPAPRLAVARLSASSSVSELRSGDGRHRQGAAEGHRQSREAQSLPDRGTHYRPARQRRGKTH